MIRVSSGGELRIEHCGWKTIPDSEVTGLVESPISTTWYSGSSQFGKRALANASAGPTVSSPWTPGKAMIPIVRRVAISTDIIAEPADGHQDIKHTFQDFDRGSTKSLNERHVSVNSICSAF